MTTLLAQHYEMGQWWTFGAGFMTWVGARDAATAQRLPKEVMRVIDSKAGNVFWHSQVGETL